jgi:3-oxoacyl-[acyl-carrier-protein] synthase-3
VSFNCRIVGVGSYVPPKVVTNQDLETMMDTTDEWIQQRSGIKTRHWVEEDVCTSDLALEATKRALADAGMEAKDLDMIVFATITPDHDFPGTSCFLQSKLGVPGIAALDIRQACSGYIYALSIAEKFIRSGSHKNILVVGAEIHSKGMDITTRGRNISVLFGDGAGATILSRCDVQDAKKDPHIIATDLHADGDHAKELWLASPGTAMGAERINHNDLENIHHYPIMHGKTVFVHAIKRMSETLTQTLAKTGYKLEDVDCFLFHQANLRINSKVAETLGIAEGKVFNTIQEFGNTTAATIPLGMDTAIKRGFLKPGMLVASAAFGSGFTWASALWRY